jgi:hypothetical protein
MESNQKPLEKQLVTPTMKKHRQQSLWQIWVPLLVLVLVGLAAGILVIISSGGGGTNVRHLADVSTIMIIMPILGIAIGALAVLAGMIFVVSWALMKLPGVGEKAQAISTQVNRVLTAVSNGSVKPVLSIRGGAAGLGKFFELLFGKKK